MLRLKSHALVSELLTRMNAAFLKLAQADHFTVQRKGVNSQAMYKLTPILITLRQDGAS
jgi:hypothetical protein